MKETKVLREVEEVASLLGKSNEFIRSQCRTKKIRASKIGKRWVIPQAEVDKLMMLDPKETTSKTELAITKLEADNKSLLMQLAAVRTFLKGANQILDSG